MRMITIITDVTKIAADAWDFPIEELRYLLAEHDGETFVYVNGRLYEAREE